MTTSAAQTTAGRAKAALYGRKGGLALGLLCLAQLMLVLDVTVVNVALPDIGTGLGLGRDALTWVLTAYTMVFGGLMLLGGRLADQFGARRVLLTGLVVFTAASAVSGLAVNGAMLIGGRVAQGAGAALLSPSALSLVTTMFTGTARNKALGVWAAVGGSGVALGVIAGGILTSAAGWPWVFFINLPVGVAVLAVLPAVIPSGPARRDRAGVDVPGALIVTAATGAAIYGLVNGGSRGWLAASTLAPVAAAAVLYAMFGLLERRAAAPLLQVRLLVRRPVAAGAFLMLVATGLLVGAFFLGSFYLQQVRGYSAVHTGLAFLPVAVAAIAGAAGASRLVALLDRRVLTSGGASARGCRWPGGRALAQPGHPRAGNVCDGTGRRGHPGRRHDHRARRCRATRGRAAVRAGQHLPRVRRRARRRGPVQPGRPQPGRRSHQPERVHPGLHHQRDRRPGRRRGRRAAGSHRKGSSYVRAVRLNGG